MSMDLNMQATQGLMYKYSYHRENIPNEEIERKKSPLTIGQKKVSIIRNMSLTSLTNLHPITKDDFDPSMFNSLEHWFRFMVE